MTLRSVLHSAVVFGFFTSLAAVGQGVPSQLFQGLHYRLIGPFRAGRAVAVTGVPGNDTTFYFGGVDGGVWKTTDAGTVWKPVFDHEPVASIGAIEVAPSDPNVIYVGTGESDIRSDLAEGDGVYKSTDAGKTWTHLGLTDSKQISRVVVDPENANVVYVGVLGDAYGPSAERGVYKSKDGGRTWQHVLYMGPSVGISDLAIAAKRPNELFAGTWNAHRPPWTTYPPIKGPGTGLYRSMDAGKTWRRLEGHGLPGGVWGRPGVAVAPDGRVVYAVIKTSLPKLSGVYRSDDGGDTWTLVNNDARLTSRDWYFDSITVDPEHPDVVYVPNVALYKLADGGRKLSIVRGAPGGDDYHQIWVDPKNSDSMILGVDQGTTLSLDGGKTWTPWYNQPTAQLYHVITNDQFPYVVYAAEQDSGSVAVYSRTNHGQITPRDWFPAGGSESGYIAPDPLNANIIYETDTYGAVDRWDRKTGLSQDVSPRPGQGFVATAINTWKYRDPWTPPLVFSKADKHALYLGTQYVMKTTDGGLHWTKISPDLTGEVTPHEKLKAGTTPTPEEAVQDGYGVVYSIAPSPLDANEIWAGSNTGLIHLTMDGGKTWQNVTPPGLKPWSCISMIEASYFDRGEAWVAVDRHRMMDNTPYIYRTTDYGKTWTLTTKGIAAGHFVRAVREDPKTPGLLFAGTEFGLDVSFDGGSDWQPMQLNLPVSSVRDMDVHDNDLIVATHGRSLWILDDMTLLRHLSTATSTAKPILFPPETAYRIDSDSFPGTPLPPEVPTAKNPPNGAIVDYYLPAKESAVVLTIRDAKGEVVRRFRSNEPPPPPRPPMPIAARWFPAPQRIVSTPGEHRFVWDLLWGATGTKKKDDDDHSASAPNGPHALPGKYTVTLTVNGVSQTEPLTVVMDPNSPATGAELQAQFEAATRIYAKTLMSRRALAEADSVRVKLEKLAKQPAVASAGLLPQVKAVQASLHALLEGEQEGTRHRPGLRHSNGELLTVLGAIETGDRTPTASALAWGADAGRAVTLQAAEWQHLKHGAMAKLNAALRTHQLKPVAIAEIEQQVYYLMTR
jgi:photosystem II stability/assembly factor-like uncharacterized protein